MNVRIRAEREADRMAVFEVNADAFPTGAEARLVDVLRDSVANCISLVAQDGEEILGHIMFTPVTLNTSNDLRLMGLAPMAVAPSAQRSGIGTRLVEAGLERCRELGVCAVAVLGHPEFYPRFGFKVSSRWNISSEYDVPEEVFMLMELIPGYLQGHDGVIHYDPAFAGV